MATATKEVCEWEPVAAAAATLAMGDVYGEEEGRGVTGMAMSVLLVVDKVAAEESAVPERGGLEDVGAGGLTVTVMRVGSVAMIVTVCAGVELVVMPDTAQMIFHAWTSLQ